MTGSSGRRPLPGQTPVADLLQARQEWARQGLTVVWTNGCFDVLHPAHVRFLTRARELGDRLVVGVNADDSVRRLKGQPRPFVPLAGRITVLAGLRAVDHVVVLSGDTPTAEVEALQPDVCCKDSDYADKPLPERAVVEAHGGRMVLLPREAGWSTTRLVALAGGEGAP